MGTLVDFELGYAHRKVDMTFTIKIHGRGLPFMVGREEQGRADPYFRLFADGEMIYESGHIENTQSPEWEEFTLERDQLGAMPRHTEIRMVVKDHDWGNADDAIGVCHFKLRPRGSLGVQRGNGADQLGG